MTVVKRKKNGRGWLQRTRTNPQDQSMEARNADDNVPEMPNEDQKGRNDHAEQKKELRAECLDMADEEYGSDFVQERGGKTQNEEVFRPEATNVDKMSYINVGQYVKYLNIDPADSVENDRLKLKHLFFSEQRNKSHTQEMRDRVNKIVTKYKDIKKKLKVCYSDVIAIVSDESSFKKDISEYAKKMFPRYSEKLQSKRKILKDITDEFNIVLIGETSSGKSTFVNVLLGEHILPSHILHTTSCICRLHNSINKRIDITGNGTVRTSLLVEDSNELKKELESMTEKLLSNDRDNKPLKTVDVYWPISSLHENVVLVDTPGIGERDALTNQVTEYVPNAAGYIFIVDSSHAGGIQDGGIKKLIEIIAKSARKEEQIEKDVDNVFFVCNKWDLVERRYRKDVLKDTKQKIVKYYGLLEDWQIVQFSAELELPLVQWNANPTDAFNALLTSLETLMIKTIQRRLGKTYRWLHTFVMEVRGFVNVRMGAESLSNEKVRAEIHKATRELRHATKELERCLEVAKMVDKEEERLVQELREYIESADARTKIFDWTNSAPELSRVRDDGLALISARIEDVVLDWAAAETGPLKQASVRITDECKKIQAEIDSRICALNNLKLGLYLVNRQDEPFSPTGRNIAIIVALSPFWITVAVVLLVIGIIPMIICRIDRAVRAKKRSIMEMTDMTEQSMRILLSGDYLEKFITASFTFPYSKWLANFKKHTQHKLDSARAMMLQMERDLHINRDTLIMLKPLQTKLNKCYACLQKLQKDI